MLGGRFHGSLQFQPSSSVSNHMKQLSSPMAPVVTVPPPSPLYLPPPPLRLRPLPVLPPLCSSATVLFESLSPPEPPDPPDASLRLVMHLLFDTSFTLSQASSNISNLEFPFPNLASDGVVSLVFVDGTRFGSNWLYPACDSSFTRVGSLTLPFILVCLLSSISVCTLVEWSERFVVCVAPDFSVMDLDYNVPMNFVSFGSTSMHVDVCSLLSVFSTALGAVISELDGQASLVLQGSSSWLMLFSAFVAVFVTFEVTRYAIIQEDYEIFRFFMVSCDVVYHRSIFCLIYPLVALMYSLCGDKLF
ncbi:LOW QUALITY PROTEIN: hypothetical protein HID58_056807 [Brassica napus]|uniref:Uncharacterized protein n=1 Tax=Brassica napus TaxID=3708 RepID=A0ABQ8APH5_BRANA|nr:LOW QUALITY PROTEIN: hypothetical protein HID58_056807 [Brassica napus]